MDPSWVPVLPQNNSELTPLKMTFLLVSGKVVGGFNTIEKPKLINLDHYPKKGQNRKLFTNNQVNTRKLTVTWGWLNFTLQEGLQLDISFQKWLKTSLLWVGSGRYLRVFHLETAPKIASNKSPSTRSNHPNSYLRTCPWALKHRVHNGWSGFDSWVICAKVKTRYMGNAHPTFNRESF